MNRRMLLLFCCGLALAAIPNQDEPVATIDCKTPDRWQTPACYAAKPTGLLYKKGTDGKDIGANTDILQLVDECVKHGDMHAPACLELDTLPTTQRLAAPVNLRIEDKK